MPSVRDQDRRRCALTTTVRIDPSPIPSDDFGPRMQFQPYRQGLRLPSRQQMDDLVLFRIDQDRAVILLATPCPVINRDHPGRTTSGNRGAFGKYQADLDVCADRAAQAVRRSCTSGASQCQGNVMVKVRQADSMSSVRNRHSRLRGMTKSHARARTIATTQAQRAIRTIIGRACQGRSASLRL